jgi:hypothetical protein
MCASCGCGMENEDHGDQRHITRKDLEEAAEAAEISVPEVVQNLQASVQSSAGTEK